MIASSSAATRIVAVIPARYASTRFPGKPLALLEGTPVIVHVARAVLQTRVLALPILVATDDERIAQTVREAFPDSQVAVVMTSENCATGTDRIAQAVTTRFGAPHSWNERLIVINVQGDEPFINPRHLETLAQAMDADPELAMATLAVPLHEAALHKSHIVKVVCARNGRALYFSRAPIPFDRDHCGAPYLRHIGVYAYEANWLLQMAALEPTPLEECEKLEQLRALEHGAALQVLVVHETVDIAIDTPQDLERAQQWLRQNHAA